MTAMIPLVLALVLTWSHRIVEKLYSLLRRESDSGKNPFPAIYIWGLCAIMLALFTRGHYVFRAPHIDTTAFALAAVALLTNVIQSHYSGYDPEGRLNIVHFVIVYPVVEEIIFRGLLLPLLNDSFHYAILEIFYKPVTLSVLITALLFALAHLQYYKLNRTSIQYMISAFIGGIVFGIIADSTESILITVLLHVEYNFLAAYYSNRMKAE